MNPIRYLLKSITVLNLLMTAVAIGFFIQFLNPLLGTPVAVKVPAEGNRSLEAPERTDERTKPATVDYTPIEAKNLFHPDRTIPAEKKSSVPVAVPRPELVLHGTLMTSEIKIAYLEDKKAVQKPPGRSAPYFVVKEGDAISGYTLKHITNNMVVLASGEEQMTLYLDEIKDRKGEITGPTRPGSPTPQPPAATGLPQVPPRPAAPGFPARPSAIQPSPPSPQPKGSFSQPSPPATRGQWGPSDLRSAPPRPSIPPPSPARSGAP